MKRSLITSASAVKKLIKKAELMEIDSVALEFQDAQVKLFNKMIHFYKTKFYRLHHSLTFAKNGTFHPHFQRNSSATISIERYECVR
jgi:hypothetical protein